jgi:hypothetical protein
MTWSLADVARTDIEARTDIGRSSASACRTSPTMMRLGRIDTVGIDQSGHL